MIIGEEGALTRTPSEADGCGGRGIRTERVPYAGRDTLLDSGHVSMVTVTMNTEALTDKLLSNVVF